jgi:hypothetical protein
MGEVDRKVYGTTHLRTFPRRQTFRLYLFCFIFFASDSADSLTALIHADDCHSFQISISKITFF